MKSLPKGLRLIPGNYLQVRVFSKGMAYTKNFGKDSPFARELAEIHIAEKRKEILMGKFGIRRENESKTFAEVGEIYFQIWGTAIDPNGKSIRSLRNVDRTRAVFRRVLAASFGRREYASISPLDIQRWRETRLEKVGGTSVNREQNVLSSIFSSIEQWIKLGKIDSFAIPEQNPCKFVEKAKIVKRERIASPYEISKLKLAAKELGDYSGCENICLALKTTLSDKDLRTLKFGDAVDLKRSKTGVRVLIPIIVTHHPDWTNWNPRWYKIREKAGCKDLQWRDLRKSGGNLLVGETDIKLLSQYMGHANQRTTEEFYTKVQQDKMAVLAKQLSDKIDAL